MRSCRAAARCALRAQPTAPARGRQGGRARKNGPRTERPAAATHAERWPGPLEGAPRSL